MDGHELQPYGLPLVVRAKYDKGRTMLVESIELNGRHHKPWWQFRGKLVTPGQGPGKAGKEVLGYLGSFELTLD